MSPNLWAPGPAAASSPAVQLEYTCDFPFLSSQAMSATVEWDSPPSVPVGSLTPALAVNVDGTVGRSIPQALGLIGVTSLDGTVDAAGTVLPPQGGSIPDPVTLAIPRTPVPASGTMTVPAHGNTPRVSFSQPGTARIAVGAVTLHLHGYHADGSAAPALPDVPCQLNPGQNNVLATVQVTLPPPSSPSAPPSATGGHGGSTGSPPSPPSGTTANPGTSSAPATAASSAPVSRPGGSVGSGAASASSGMASSSAGSATASASPSSADAIAAGPPSAPGGTGSAAGPGGTGGTGVSSEAAADATHAGGSDGMTWLWVALAAVVLSGVGMTGYARVRLSRHRRDG